MAHSLSLFLSHRLNLSTSVTEYAILPSLTHFRNVPEKKKSWAFETVKRWGESRKPTTKWNKYIERRSGENIWFKQQETYQVKQSPEWKFNECHVTCNEYNRFTFCIHSIGTPEEKSVFQPSISDVCMCKLARNISLCLQIFIRLLVVCYVLFFLVFLIELLRFEIYVDVGIIQFVTFFSYTIASKIALWAHGFDVRKWVKRLYVVLYYHTEIEHRFT